MKSQAYDLDEMAISRFGIPSKNLMGEAGRNVSKFIKDNIKTIIGILVIVGLVFYFTGGNEEPAQVESTEQVQPDSNSGE